ncbi:ORF-127 [Agrotis segetum nucleopolyhedrovirus A]|uniref:ORF-127 n=1 Tax=Agrotis segetum nuclear polyhedrosis virus TaxID=1962501 RepID=Q287E5_NPVAS|nr:ORF-127 [Agrotis segetum nucleopolyhedrovirus A]AAZ38293.1 ORF-127 [Agrotis segetum nucleopolyhedrovirus A]
MIHTKPLNMILPNAKICPIMQYKCEYLNTIAVYSKRLGNASKYKLPDISDLDLQDTFEFLMYAPIEKVLCENATPLKKSSVLFDYGMSFFDVISTADKMCTYASYANLPNPSRCQFIFDVYDFDNISFGDTLIKNVGLLCMKNAEFYNLMLSLFTYELYARLDFFQHFTLANIQVVANYALEWVVCIKVCAQILCGLILLNKKNETCECVAIKCLFNLCLNILKADFFPSFNVQKYRYLFETAQYLRHGVFSEEVALVTDLRVPIDTTNFIVNNHQHKQDTVDMLSFYTFRGAFIERLCKTIDIKYPQQADTRIHFHIIFLNGNQNKNNIIDHIIDHL